MIKLEYQIEEQEGGQVTIHMPDSTPECTDRELAVAQRLINAVQAFMLKEGAKAQEAMLASGPHLPC